MVNGEQKLQKIEVKGYIIDVFDGLRVSYNCNEMYTCTRKSQVLFDNFLQALLSNPAIKEEISVPHASSDNVMRDICDGEFVRSHKIFSVHPDGLQFLLYYDDIELCNALGAKAGKHKLGKLRTILFSVVLVTPFLVFSLLCRSILLQFGKYSTNVPVITANHAAGSNCQDIGYPHLRLRLAAGAICGEHKHAS